jgi:uncharacterized repeat protein (TIGR02543 family)
VGSFPFSVAIGDFNGDGKQDLAVANEYSDTVSIRLGDGLGGFSGSTDVTVGVLPRSVAIGDFNGDGKQDLAVANQNSNKVSIRMGECMYTVTYALGGGTGSLPSQADVASGGTFTVASGSGITRTGYTFAGWNDGTTTYQPNSTYTIGASNVTLTAQWTANSYTVTYAFGGGTGTLPTQGNVVTDGTFAVASGTGVTRTGYTFAGWNDGTKTYQPNDVYTMGAADVTLTAQWTDSQPPVVTPFTPLGNTTPGTAQNLTVEAADNVGVTSLSVEYSVNGGAPASVACLLTGTNNCVIPGQAAGSAVAYYVRATDAAGNPSDHPGSASPDLYTVSGAPITVPAGNYSDIALSDGSTLGGDVTVTGNLALGGVVTGGVNTLTLGCGSTVTGAGPGAYVNGAVKKDFCGNGAFSYPVGQAGSAPPLADYPAAPGGYAPVSVDITALGINPSSLTVTSWAATLGGFNAAASLTRNWDLVETGDLTATLSFSYPLADVYGSEADYTVWRREGNGIPTNMCPGGPCVDIVNHVIGPVTGVTQFSRWTGAVAGPTAGLATLSGHVTSSDGRGVRNAVVTVGSNILPARRAAITGPFGYYRIDNLQVGETYVVTVQSKRFTFKVPSRVISLADNLTDVDFVGNP